MKVVSFSLPHLELMEPPILVPNIHYPISGLTFFHDGLPVAAVGFVPRTSDTAEAWAVFSSGWSHHILTIIRTIKEYLPMLREVYNVKTLYANANFVQAERFLRLLGFSRSVEGGWKI